MAYIMKESNVFYLNLLKQKRWMAKGEKETIHLFINGKGLCIMNPF